MEMKHTNSDYNVQIAKHIPNNESNQCFVTYMTINEHKKTI